MPRLISRDEAIARAQHERPDGACTLCAIESSTGQRILARSDHSVAILSRYPRQWGHLLVVVRQHVTSFQALSEAQWLDASRLAFSAARILERTLEPARVYVASLGTSTHDLPMSFPHVHLHVLPVHDPQDKPSTILTWDRGVFEADDAEWNALEETLRTHWP